MSSATRTRVQGASSTSTLAHAKRLADERVETVEVTVGADARSGPYYAGDAHCVQIAATGNCKFQIRGGGGSGGLANTVYRDLTMGGLSQTSTASRVGVISAAVMPYEFYLFDTSGSSNPITMYITY